MIEVELIHPPHYNSTDDRLDPPLGLLSIATTIKIYKPEIKIKINDLSGIKSDLEIKVGYADVYGITVYCSTINTVRNIISKCREVNPNSIVCIGGAHVTALPDTLSDVVDHVIVGYGELPMVQLLTSYKKLPKVIHGNHLINYPIKMDWSPVDINSYSRRIDGKKSIPILTTRGCPYKCNICGLHKLHNICSTVLFSKPDDVYDYINYIKNEIKIAALNIQDDIFTLDKKRLFKILKLIKPLGMKFRCMGRAGYDTEETYEKLAEAGCVGVAWGIESGSQDILNKMNKLSTVQDNYNVIKWCQKYGMDARAFFVLGFPGETEETIKKTKEFIIKSDVDQYFVSNFIPYPGTPVWEKPNAFGITKMSYDFDEYYMVSNDGSGGSIISTKWLSKEKLRELEIDLRSWLKENKPIRGKNIQKYEYDNDE